MATNVVLVLGLVVLEIVVGIVVAADADETKLSSLVASAVCTQYFKYHILNVLQLFHFATDRRPNQSSHTDW